MVKEREGDGVKSHCCLQRIYCILVFVMPRASALIPSFNFIDKLALKSISFFLIRVLHCIFGSINLFPVFDISTKDPIDKEYSSFIVSSHFIHAFLSNACRAFHSLINTHILALNIRYFPVSPEASGFCLDLRCICSSVCISDYLIQSFTSEVQYSTSILAF